MTGRENADEKWSENKIEGEDSLTTVNCLRGRLLAERLASRNAREEAEQLGNKLLELENQLKEETKSRNRAEKKLKFLMKRLESMNISCFTDESEQPCLLDKSENPQTNLSMVCGSQEFKENFKTLKLSANSQENDSLLSSWSLSHDSCTTEGSLTSSFEVNLHLLLKGQQCEMESNENPISSTADDCLSSAGELHSGKPSQLNSNQMYNESSTDEQRMESSIEEGLKQEDDQDPDNHVDNSMALIQVEMPLENERIDPEIVDATVKEVLESLRRAKQQLQSSMERRRMSMIRVG